MRIEVEGRGSGLRGEGLGVGDWGVRNRDTAGRSVFRVWIRGFGVKRLDPRVQGLEVRSGGITVQGLASGVRV